uniref:Histone deacetylase n=1 Tax=Caenorhabditis japonica TaxID=281687 RepID=A0A8R1DVB5_CAEJA
MFALMTYQLSSLAGGRILAVLEGGYNLTSISNSALAVCEVLQNRAMLRRICEEKEHFATEKMKSSSWSIKAVRDVCAAQQKHWSILRGFQIIIGSVDGSKLLRVSGKPRSATRKTGSGTGSASAKSHKRTPKVRTRRVSENVDDVVDRLQNLAL